MAYTTEAAVRNIIEVDAEVDVVTMVSDAAMMIDDIINLGVPLVPALTPDRLEAVNRWLAAHLLSAGPAPRTASEGAKGLTEAYQYKLSDGLGTTMYGAQAMLLDSTGRLAAWSKAMVDGGKPRVKINWLGRR